MKNLGLRALFGALYVAMIVAGILCGQITCLLLLFLLGALAVNEFTSITATLCHPESQTDLLLMRSLDCAGGLLLIFNVWFNPLPVAVGCLLIWLLVRLSAQLWIKSCNSVIALALSMMSLVYVALPIGLMSGIYRVSPHLLLLLFVLVWINDTFAFLTGCTLGRHRLFERISPKKSWEGFIGGAVFTILASGLSIFLFPHTYLGLWAMIGLGVVVTISATLGDLVESLIKRTIGVKDSGNLIPGHGGILDRIDSILFVIPASFAYMLLII